MTVERKLMFGFLVAVVVMVVNVIAPFETLFEIRATQERLLHSDRFIQELSNVFSVLKDGETGQRGYVITGREEFLEPYRSALTHLHKHLGVAHDLAMGDVVQSQSLKELEPLINTKLSHMANLIDLRRAQGFEAAANTILGGEPKRAMDQIRTKVNSIIDDEKAKRAIVQRELDRQANLAAIMGLVITLLNVVLVVLVAFVAYFVFRTLKERYRVTNELRTISEQLSVNLTELERRNREIALLSRMAQAIESPTSLDEAFGTISTYCAKLLPATSGAVYLFRNPGDLLEKEAQWGEPVTIREVFEPNACWALRRGQPHKVLSTDDVLCPHRGTDAHRDRPYLCSPLMAQGEILGLIAIESKMENGQASWRLDQRDEALSLAISEQVSLALSNAKLREKLRQQSIIDPLTGLYNRRYMEEALRRELVRAGRKFAPLSVIMLDIDHFKRVNDTLGHDAGDLVLRSFACEIKRGVREVDIACRYGGEELAIILPECDKKTTLDRAEKIAKRVRMLDVRCGGQQIGRITASLGVSTFPEDGEESQLLLQAADRALYHAKHTGRDRVVAAGAGQKTMLGVVRSGQQGADEGGEAS